MARVQNRIEGAGDHSVLVIACRNREFRVLIDHEDVGQVSAIKWRIIGTQRRPYVATGVESRYLHRLLLHAEMVDHANRNTLDNRKANLRPATNSQNIRNSPKPKHSKNHFKGVRRVKARWQARIREGNLYKNLGCFATEIEAAKAYNEAASRLSGEFAFLNDLQESP